MAEAIFAKYSKSSLNSSELISNSTKSALGLSNSATLDDCFRTLTYRSDTMATVLVTVKDIDGSVVPNTDVYMNVPAGTGANLIYKTDANGMCIFKINAGTANFSDHAYDNYIDVNGQTNIRVDCPVGSVKEITLQRYKVFQNGGVVGNFTSNRTVNFSKWANTVDVTIKGEDGQGGPSSSLIVTNLANGGSGISIGIQGNFNFNYVYYTNGYGFETTNFSVVSYAVSGRPNVQCYNNSFDNVYVYPIYLNQINTAYNYCISDFYNLPGCNGSAGENKTRKGVSVTNISTSIISYRSGKSSYTGYHQFYNKNYTDGQYVKAAMYPDYKVNQSGLNFSYNGSTGTVKYVGNMYFYLTRGRSVDNSFNTTSRSSGSTGATISAFGITATGGNGGYAIPYIGGENRSIRSYINIYNNHKNDIGGGNGGNASYLKMNINIHNSDIVIHSDGWYSNLHTAIGTMDGGKNNIRVTGNAYFQPGSNGNAGYVNIYNIRYK